MKNGPGKTWIIIATVTIIAIIIFYFLSKKLEIFVSNDRNQKAVIIDEILEDIK